MVEHPIQLEDSGSNPTPSLHLHKQDWWVQTIDLLVAQEFIKKYHYAGGGANTATFRHGLFPRSERGRKRFQSSFCFGVAWWIPPTKTAAMATFPQGDWKKVLSLSRLAIKPGMPKNAATFLLMHSVREIKKDGRFKCLVTYADEWQGHLGGIYKAAGWDYKGKTKPERTYVDSTGRMISRKAGPKTRTHAEMLVLGYKMTGSFSKHKFVKFL